MIVLQGLLNLWLKICFVAMQTWPNCYLTPHVQKISKTVVDHFWPPDTSTFYGSLGYIGKYITFNATISTIIITVEAVFIYLGILKIKKYLQERTAPQNKIIKGLKIREYLGSYVSLILLAFIIVQVLSLKNAKVISLVKPEDKQTQEKYLRMYVLINSGDKSGVNMHPEEAKKYYQEAYDGLMQIQNEKPDWEPTIIKFRLRYLREKLGIPESSTNPQ